MSDQTQACNNTDPKPTRLQLVWKEAKWQGELLLRRLFYRCFSRLIHRFGMHQMKRLHPMGGDPFYRCDWCGMHGKKVEVRDRPFILASCREARQCLHIVPGCICNGDPTSPLSATIQPMTKETDQ